MDGAKERRLAVQRVAARESDRHWQVWLRVSLELPPVNDPRAMAEIERLREQADDEYRAQRQKEEAEFLERQHRLNLQKEGGGKIRPEDFARNNGFSGQVRPKPWKSSSVFLAAEPGNSRRCLIITKI